MSVGPMGMLGSVAGSPLPQAKGSDSERAAQETTGQQRETTTNQKAEAASGVGQTAEDQQASDRDADGRRLWEPQQQPAADSDTDDNTPPAAQSKDPYGDRGANLDLSG